MHVLDFIYIILFVCLVLVTGLSFARSGGKDMKSFFAAGGTIPWWMSGLSLFMGFFSAGTFVVWGAIAYSYGFVSLGIQWTMAIAGIIIGCIIAPRWHRTKVLTAAEYITMRFGKRVQRVYTYLFLFISLFTSGAFLYPVAKIVSVAAGMDLYTCILLLGGISILYVSVGGLWSVVVTDVLQFIILLSAVIIVLPLSLDKVGGLSAFFDGMPEGFTRFAGGEYTWGFLLAFGFYNMIFLGGNWAYVQRYTSVRTASDSRKVGWLFGLLYVVSPVLWMLPPMLYRVYDSSLTGLEAEGAYLMMCKSVLPHGMLGIMLGGMVFATASSLNSALNISSGVFTNDIYQRIRPSVTDAKLIRVARLSTMMFGVLAVLVALMIPVMGGIVNVVISIGALTGVPLYLPIIWSLYSKSQNARSVMGITLCCLGVNVICKFVTPLLGVLVLNRTEEMVLGVGLPVLLLVVSELVFKWRGYTDPMYAAYEENTAGQGNCPKEEQTPVNASQNSYGTRVMGYAVTVCGVFILSVGVYAWQHAYVILPVAAVLMGVGLIVVINSKKK